ncbi:hypothetical protein Btru_016077 [Bulinus truncatus]|nr:hypothetical protein Btru_016077 [Bulinus truncatus]
MKSHQQEIKLHLRAKLAVVIVFISWIPANVYFTLLLRFEYINDPQINQTIGYILRSDLMLNHPDVYKIISGFFFMISGPVPVIFVIIICVALGLKIRIIKAKRKNITSKVSLELNNMFNGKKMNTIDNENYIVRYETQGTNTVNSFNVVERRDKKYHIEQKSSVSQTTLMLLSMCVVYSIIVTSTSVPSIIFNRDTWESDTGAVVELCSQLAVCINSSSNFLIYVALNRNFRTTLKLLICSLKK